MTLISKLPTVIPVDDTPKTYSGTALRTFLLAPGATVLIVALVVTNTALVAKDATTMQLSSVSDVTIPAGTVLTFGTTEVTVMTEEELTSVASAVTIAAAPAEIAANATAEYSNLTEVPVAEESNPSITDSEETIQVHGRYTPVRSVNGKDMTATIRTIAGIGDPVVKRLTTKGFEISPNNVERVVWLYPDGFALLATVNVGAPMRQSAPGNTQRAQFTANLSGKLAWTDVNETTPVWNVVG
ncbi:hypothetical protein [Deinococcus marmoris]|uniref:hypothetical protein n=1 Tax=Deinococcus marmoris TaxID=249408 RepID=UPI000495B277|nr:hypothetical protein [Deinococcus marmoris]